MKKKKTKERVSRKNTTPDLPQNIVPVGERVFDDKNIYIHQKVYAQIHKFAANKTENEYGGILVGRILNEMGKENTIIEGFIEAKYNAATPTTLTFTHETWEYFHSEMDRKYKDKKIVGWIHTHPNFGIFLSENDRFIQQNFFTDANQVAYVVDPIQNDEGFFFWVNEKLERCPGFYLFDKNGVKIKQKAWSTDLDELNEDVVVKHSKIHPILTITLVLVMLVNLFVIMQQSRKIDALEKQVENQKLVLQYGVLGVYGNPEISVVADNIRKQIEAQEKSKKETIQDDTKQKKEQHSAEVNESEHKEETNGEETEKTKELEENETNTENNGGTE